MKFKRLMAVLLSVAMVVGMMPAIVFAKEIDDAQAVKVSADDPEPKEDETQKPEEEKKPAKEDDKKTESDSGKKTEPEDKKTESEGEKQPESEPEKEPETKEEQPSTDDGKKTGAEGEEKPETKEEDKTEPDVKEEPKTEGEKKPETDSDKKTESEGEDKPKDESDNRSLIRVKGPEITYTEDETSDSKSQFNDFSSNSTILLTDCSDRGYLSSRTTKLQNINYHSSLDAHFIS